MSDFMQSSCTSNISSPRPASTERQRKFAGAPSSRLVLPDGCCCGVWRHGIPRWAAAAAAARCVDRPVAAAPCERTVNCVAAAVQQTDANAPFVCELADGHAPMMPSSLSMFPYCPSQIDVIRTSLTPLHTNLVCFFGIAPRVLTFACRRIQRIGHMHSLFCFRFSDVSERIGNFGSLRFTRGSCSVLESES